MTSKKSYGLSVLVLIVALLSAVAQSQSEKTIAQNPCVRKTTCSQCMQTSSCAWCMEEKYGERPRCFDPSIQYDRCPEEFTWTPDNEQRTLIAHQLTGASSKNGSSASGDIIQIRPQSVSLKLRLNQEHRLSVKYSPAEDNERSSSIELKDNASSYVKVTYFSACLGGGNPIATNKCDGLKVGDVVDFSVEIVVTSCPQKPKEWTELFQIYPVGINERLAIDLEMICDCPCERSDHPTYEKYSRRCHSRETYKCYACDCPEGSYGDRCECLGPNPFLDDKLICRRDNTTTALCSGRGLCICGRCDCDQRDRAEEVIYGEFCECDNYLCPDRNGLICSGPDHGTCECGVCVCKPGWAGTACDCNSATDNCPKDEGRGECGACGACN